MADDFRRATDDELGAVYALRGRAFRLEGDADGGASWFAAHDREDPWRAAGANYVATRDGLIVASVRVFARRLRAGPHDPPVPVAVLADVATDPAHQGQGYMRRLLDYVNGRNAASGFDMAIVCTSSHGAYTGAGFRIMPIPWYTLDLSAGGAGGGVAPAHWMVVADAPDDEAGMRAVYEAFGARRPGYLARDDAYWTHPASLRRADPDAWLRFAIDAGGAVGAYLLASPRQWTAPGVALLECPYRPGAADAVPALLGALAADIAAGAWAGVGLTLDGPLPGDHALFAPDAPLPGRRGLSNLMMLRSYTPAGARLEEALRREADGRFILWLTDWV